ncbi:MAG TPA: signal peptidase I [Acidimicrobiales bacterium]|nr:signal peptidase I [Acidimicrobiales bacterium]
MSGRDLRRVGTYLAQVAVTALAVAAACLLVVPKALGWHGVLVLSGSMEPTLQSGGVAFVDPVRPEAVHVGDVITFQRPGGWQVTHRVVEVTATTDGPRFRTKGDANDVADAWVVGSKALVGKVRYAFPGAAGVVGLLVGNTQLLGVLMLIPAAYLVVGEVRPSRRRLRVRGADG